MNTPTVNGSSTPRIGMEDEYDEQWIRLSAEEQMSNQVRTLAGVGRRPSYSVESPSDRPWRGQFGQKEIEENIIEELLWRHERWINSAGGAQQSPSHGAVSSAALSSALAGK